MVRYKLKFLRNITNSVKNYFGEKIESFEWFVSIHILSPTTVKILYICLVHNLNKMRLNLVIR